MKLKTLSSIVLALLLSLNTLIPANAEPANEQNQQQTASEQQDNSPAPHAGAAILADMKSGKILFEKNPDAKMYPASTTKILTGILALENTTMTDTVIATSEAISPITNNHSHMGILVGEELTVEQLLYGMLVYSANDAANVLAVHISGSIEAFCQRMNEKAAELGAINSHFANPHGYHDDNHYTTASDLVKITRYAMQNEQFRSIVATDMYTMPPTNKYDETRYLSSTNHLISRRRYSNYFYNKAIGIKTGFTDEAGSCLVSAATDGDTELLSVIMKCENTTMVEDGAYSFVDSKKLLEYGFDNFEYINVATVGDFVSDSKVYEAKDNERVVLTVENDIGNILPVDYKKEDIKTNITFNDKLIAAPIKKGDVLGTVVYEYRGEEIGSANLISTVDIKKDYIIATIHLIGKILFNPIFIIFVLLIVILRIRAIRIQRRRRRHRISKLQHIENNIDYSRRKR